MANGFKEGYFGIQVNSDKERRILFSIWSPFTTDDPKSIPDSLKIVLLNKGKNVYTGEFGNEGSGGQSYLRFNWKADVTYKFLTQIKPNGELAFIQLPAPTEQALQLLLPAIIANVMKRLVMRQRARL